jgi:16S rRNA (guanine1207-N2)-methyltransferase
VTARAEEAVYGAPPPILAASASDAVQISPLAPGSQPIETLDDGALSRLVILAPPGTLERRYVIAQGLRATAQGGELIVLAPKTRGGARLAEELAAFGCSVSETARRHHRICHTSRPAAPHGLAEAIAGGAPRLLADLGLWTQPGVFSWNRLDPGTALLLRHAQGLSGRGADLGCGIGILGRRALEEGGVAELVLADIDRRALEAARRNIDDPRARFLHADVRMGHADLADLDFVLMNPPFHEGGQEDRGLGVAFIAAAAGALRKGGACRLVANVALPYEGSLNAFFARMTILGQAGGYKVYEAVK